VGGVHVRWYARHSGRVNSGLHPIVMQRRDIRRCYGAPRHYDFWGVPPSQVIRLRDMFAVLDDFLSGGADHTVTSLFGGVLVVSHISRSGCRTTAAPSDPFWLVMSRGAILTAPQKRRACAAVLLCRVFNVGLERIAVEPLPSHPTATLLCDVRPCTSRCANRCAQSNSISIDAAHSNRGRAGPFHKVDVFSVTRSPLTKEMPCTT